MGGVDYHYLRQSTPPSSRRLGASPFFPCGIYSFARLHGGLSITGRAVGRLMAVLDGNVGRISPLSETIIRRSRSGLQ